jgi:Rrf2 family transcriptional regulator, iron-sulfur cluster assembly transcription factor
MRFTTKTEYGLVCLVYLAKQPENDVIAVRDIVRDEHYSITFTEKIFQKLRMARIVLSHHGKQGGYSLARPPAEITLKEIIEALEGETFDIFCNPDIRKNIVCTHHELCEVSPVWRKTKEILDNYYSSVTLEMLSRGDFEPSSSVAQIG